MSKREYPRQCEACGVIVMSAYEDAFDGHDDHEQKLRAYRLGRRMAPFVLVGVLVLAFAFGMGVLGPLIVGK